MNANLLRKAFSTCLRAVFVIVLVVVFLFISFKNQSIDAPADFGIFWFVGDKIWHGNLDLVYDADPQGNFNDFHLRYFTYPPNFAVAVCAPLALLPRNMSFGVFIWILICGLVANGFLFASAQTHKSALAFVSSAVKAVVVGIAFLPMAMAFSIGQPGLLVGLLPMTAAYVSLIKRKYLLAGLLLAPLLLKPQFLLPVALIGVACVISAFWSKRSEDAVFVTKKQLGLFAIGLAISVAINFLLSASVFGLEGFPLWIRRIQSSVNYVYGHAGYDKYQEPYQLISSLPMSFAFIFREQPVAIIKTISGAFVLLASVFEIFCLTKIANVDTSRRMKLDLMVMSALTSVTVLSPYLRLYDLSLIVLPAWIIFFAVTLEKKPLAVLKPITLILWILVDVRVLSIPQEVAASWLWLNVVFVILLTVYWLVVNGVILRSLTALSCERGQTESGV